MKRIIRESNTLEKLGEMRKLQNNKDDQNYAKRNRKLGQSYIIKGIDFIKLSSTTTKSGSLRSAVEFNETVKENTIPAFHYTVQRICNVPDTNSKVSAKKIKLQVNFPGNANIKKGEKIY